MLTPTFLSFLYSEMAFEGNREICNVDDDGSRTKLMTSILSCVPDVIHIFSVISGGLLRNVGVNVAVLFLCHK